MDRGTFCWQGITFKTMVNVYTRILSHWEGMGISVGLGTFCGKEIRFNARIIVYLV